LSAVERLRSYSNVSYSRIIQEALRILISERTLGDCVAVGFINVLYDHEKKDSDTALTDVQHEFLDVVLFSNHIHIDERRCLLSIAVKGQTRRVEALIKAIEEVPGLMLVKPVLVCL